MEVITSQDYQHMAWRNGGGKTAEIATGFSSASEDNKAFDWRVSLAEVSRDGPYSNFSGYNRILTLVSGQGTELTDPTGNVLRIDQLFQPCAFSGEVAYDGRLLAGPIENFNLIYRPDRLSAQVHRLEMLDHITLPPPGSDESRLLYLARSSNPVEVKGRTHLLNLTQGDSLLCRGPAEDGPLELRASGEAIVLLVTLQPPG